MKHILLAIGILFLSHPYLHAQQSAQNDVSYGLLFMGGVRYDDVRMCVATPAGVKGGPMADVQLVIRWRLSEDKSLAFNLPIMRPILFYSAFDMIQFEPQVDLETTTILDSGTRLITGPGLGISFHKGPGYESDQANPGNSFTALGPIFSWKLAVALNSDQKSVTTIGAKVFYTPLFASGHADGKVIGIAFEYQKGF